MITYQETGLAYGYQLRSADYTPADHDLALVSFGAQSATQVDYPINASATSPHSSWLLVVVILTALLILVSALQAYLWREIFLK